MFVSGRAATAPASAQSWPQPHDVRSAQVRAHPNIISSRTYKHVYIYIYIYISWILSCQKCTSKGTRRQGIVLKHRSSLQRSLLPCRHMPLLMLTLAKRGWINGVPAKCP